jgi:sugar phosphate isomerase/epimerase
MKLGFSTVGCPNWGIQQIIEAARANGYDGIELRCYRGSLDLLKTLGEFPGGPAGFKRRLSRAGLEVCCLDTSVHLTEADLSVADGYRMVDLAMALGAPYLRVFGGEIPAGESREACLAGAAQRLAHLGPRAAQRGKRVLVETHDSFSSGAAVGALLDAAGSEGTGALWDLHHAYRTGETPGETAARIAGRTYHTHVKDGHKYGPYTLLGEGDVPIAELVASLHAAGYQGYLCLEWEKLWHPELPDPGVALPQGARYLSDLLRRLGIPRG